MKKLYSALYDDNCHPFNALLANPQNVEVVRDPDQLENDGALIIWGGSDINPQLYNHPAHSTTYPGGLRDRLEWSLLTRAKEIGLPIIGVCRGAQMLCAAAGGFLLQDVHNHHGHHEVVTHDGVKFNVNSIHHQMMAGFTMIDHELVAWREGRRGAPYGYMNDQTYSPPENWKEPEFVYFRAINGYAIQWHPEMMGEESQATQYVLNYIRKTEAERNASYATATIELN